MAHKPDSDGPAKRGARSRLERTAQAGRTIGMAYTIMAMIFVGPVLGYFLGVWLEGRWGHAPWLSFGGLVLGGVASVRKVIQLLRQSQNGRDR